MLALSLAALARGLARLVGWGMRGPERSEGASESALDPGMRANRGPGVGPGRGFGGLVMVEVSDHSALTTTIQDTTSLLDSLME